MPIIGCCCMDGISVRAGHLIVSSVPSTVSVRSVLITVKYNKVETKRILKYLKDIAANNGVTGAAVSAAVTRFVDRLSIDG